MNDKQMEAKKKMLYPYMSELPDKFATKIELKHINRYERRKEKQKLKTIYQLGRCEVGRNQN